MICNTARLIKTNKISRAEKIVLTSALFILVVFIAACFYEHHKSKKREMARAEINSIQQKFYNNVSSYTRPTRKPLVQKIWAGNVQQTR